MISAINGINGYISTYRVYSTQQVLTEQTRALLESFGVNTAGIRTEAEGQAALMQAINAGNAQNVRDSQNIQPQQPSFSGANPLMDALMKDAVALAQKVGAQISPNDDLNDILTAISNRITQLQTEAANNLQRLARVAEYQAEYLQLCELADNLRAAMPLQNDQKQSIDTSNTIETSMSGLANYNIVGMSIHSAHKIRN